MGSAGAKVISVARDVTDIYVHAGGQYEWDSAAPVVVARAAGLHTSRADGATLAYNQDDVWLPDLLVCRPEFADIVSALRPRLLGRARPVSESRPRCTPCIALRDEPARRSPPPSPPSRRLRAGARARADSAVAIDPRPDRARARSAPSVAGRARVTVPRQPEPATHRPRRDGHRRARPTTSPTALQSPARRRARSSPTRPGRPCRTSGCRRAPTPSAAGSRCCAGSSTRATTARPRHARRPVSVIVAPVRSVLQPQVKGLADLEPVRLHEGDEVDLDDVVRRLAAAAYHRVDLVERRGEFAVRGGIVDVFPPTEEHPIRVEFWGDEVEEIRSFAVADQRSLEQVADGLWAPPCRELLLTDEVRAERAQLGRRSPRAARDARQDGRGARRRGHGVARAGPGRRHGAARRPAARPMRSCWSATPSGYGRAPTTWSRPARSSCRPRGRPRPAEAGADRPRAPPPTARSATCARTRSAAASRGGRSRRSALDPDRGRLAAPRRCAPRPARSSRVDVDIVEHASRRLRSTSGRRRPYRGDTEAAVADIAPVGTRAAAASSLVTEGHGPAARLVEVLGEHDVAARLVDDLDSEPRRGDVRRPADGVVRVAQGSLAARASSPTRSTSSCSPATTSRASARPAATRGGCRRGAASRSTRSSCGPATTSCTSSTASAATSR